MRACTSLFTDRGSRVAPAWGDSCVLHICAVWRCFNPHTPCGVRPPMVPRVCDSFNPRTPAWCDKRGSTQDSLLSHFNPRTPCWMRQKGASVYIIDPLQSTHPCGVRPAAATKHRDEQISFNPRTPCGVRRPCIVAKELSLQSAHPAWV